MAGVACTHRAMIASEAGYCALGWRKPVPVLNELSEGCHMQALGLHMSCG
jgi:hypothetical protein